MTRLHLLPILALATTAAQADAPGLTWTQMPPLPELGEIAQIGRSGLCGGTLGESIVLAGGANFPEPGRTASRGGTKTFYDDILVLTDGTWTRAETTLPVKGDSFLSAQHGDRVICAGGQGLAPGAEKAGPLAEVFALSSAEGGVTVEMLPPLPEPSVGGIGGVEGGRLIATVGMAVYALDLTAPEGGWTKLADIPGPKRSTYGGTLADGRLWVVGGRNKDGDDWTHYDSVHSLDLTSGAWEEHAPFPVPAGFVTVIDAGDGRLLTVGGVDADYFLRIQSQVIPRNKAERGSPEWERLNDNVTWLFDHHPGFMAQVFAYDIAADSWEQAGWHPGPSPISRAPIAAEGGWVLAGGEVSAGKRTPSVWRLDVDD